MTIQALSVERMEEELAIAVRQVLESRLAVAHPGHCLRVGNLAPRVMKHLCAEMQGNDSYDVVLLLGPRQKPEFPWHVTATRLVELRNLEARPLLAFIPPAIKTAAEDSFDKSTFQDVPLTDVMHQIWNKLYGKIPEDLQRYTRSAIDYIRQVRSLSDADLVRYFLTVTENGANHESAGAAIYHLHAIPDFALFVQPDRIRQRLDQNLTAVQVLSDGAGSLLGRVHSLKLKPDTIQLALYQHLSQFTGKSVSVWGESVACNPDCRLLSFDEWQFEGEDPNRSMLITVDDLNELATRDQSTTPGADNPRYLDLNKAKTVRVKWTTDPKPTIAPGLVYFRIEIISTDEVGSGAVAWESKNIPVGKSAKPERSKSLKVSEFGQYLEEGLYYFRVRGYSATGDILNDENPENKHVLRDPENPDGKRTNESEDIWFWKSEAEEPPPVEPTRNQSVTSFSEARTLAYLAAIERGQDPFATPPQLQVDRTGWAVAKSSSRLEDIYNIVFDAQTRFTLSVSSKLRQIERDTLGDARNLGRWRWTVSDLPGVAQSEPILRSYGNPSRIPDEFLSARKAVFAAIRGTDQEDKLTSATDLLGCDNLIITYAQTYVKWLSNAEENFEQQMLAGSAESKRTDPLVLDIDVLELRLGEEDRYQSVYLLAPTHPLRLLWLLQRARLADVWLRTAMSSGIPQQLLSESVRQLIRRDLTPYNLPPVLRSSRDDRPDQIMRFFLEHGSLAGDWSLYLREDSEDSQMLQTRVARLLGQNYSTDSWERHAAKGIARSIRRYLVQHPYVKTLKINMFNPGDAQVLVDAILEVEKELLHRYGSGSGLRYIVNLFGEGDRIETIGGALEELQNPERQVSEEADAFTQAGSNPLFPKLVYSRNHIDQFLPRQKQFQAHIAILQDLFPHKVTLQPPFVGRSSFLHGLIQEQRALFTSSEDRVAWQYQLIPNVPRPLVTDDPIPTLLANLLNKISRLQASNAVGKLVERVPTVELRLDVSARGLLHAIHVNSDWVLTADRNLGLEYFDRDAHEDRSLYLLDFRPEYGSTSSPRIMVTTRAIDEIQRIVRPRLDQYGLVIQEGVEIEFLNVLRSLSGRIAMKLLSAPTQVAEAIGLALARLFLEQYELLENAIIIPLDAHSDLFNGTAANAFDTEMSLQRSDLLLVTADHHLRRLYLHVVEVKFHADLSSFSAYNAVQAKVEQQVTNTIDFLRSHYDTGFQAIDRLDRELKTRELIELLSFYLARALRYGLLNAESAETEQRFIEQLDDGYDLKFRASGLMFDLAGRGVQSTEAHADLVFHRIGRDIIERLLSNALRRRVLRQADVRSSAKLLEEPEEAVNLRSQQMITTTFRSDESYQRVRTCFHTNGITDDARTNEHTSPPHDLEDMDYTEVQVVTEEIAAETNSSADREWDQPTTSHRLVMDEGHEQMVTSFQQVTPDSSIAPNHSEQTILAITSSDQSSDLSAAPPVYDILVGNDALDAKQYGILGMSGGRRIGIDLNTTNTISLFGVQGGGKSYTLGTIVEMATQPFHGLNLLPRPLASVIFHYHENQDYPPEFVSMVRSNSNADEITILRQEYGVEPDRLNDILLLTSADKLAERRAEFPSLHVEPIYFSSSELSIKDWRFLMGVAGNQMYMKQTNLIMRQLRDQITLSKLRSEISASDLNDSQKKILDLRLDIAAQFINDDYRLAAQMRPGRLIIVDLRDEYIDKDEALGLFVVMLNIFANAGRDNHREGLEGFNKLIVFDEAHKYMDNPDLTGHIVDVIRQMRHQGVSVLIASQDPPSLPNAIIELSSLLVLHRFNSPQWLKHIQKSVTALSDLTPAQLSSLRAGDAFVWSTKSTERTFTQKAIKMRLRPRATEHGGGTQTAV
jgi:hypothetical protein